MSNYLKNSIKFTHYFYPCPKFGIVWAPFLNTLKNPTVWQCVKQVSHDCSNATEVAINYASGICICIDFNMSHFLHAGFCTCWRITGVLPNIRHVRLFSHSHAPLLTFSRGKWNKKSIIKIIIESPLVWGFAYCFFTVALGNVGGICGNCRGVLE